VGNALEGRVAVITGASGGLGREYARLFAAEGAQLVLADRELGAGAPGNAEPLSELVDEFAAGGTEVVAYRGDIGAESAGDHLVSLSRERFGTLDVLVNNAGNWYDGPLAESPLEFWDSIMHVHLRGHFLTLRAAARYWADAHKSGRPVNASVVNTASRSALNAIAGHSVYAAAKGGIIALTHVAAKELAAYGVRVNCIAPAARTGMTLGIAALAETVKAPPSPDDFDEWDPANVAPLVAYLATKDCPVTGEILFARGGTVQRYAPWEPGLALEKRGRWTVAELAERVPGLLPGVPVSTAGA
jgi:NAD(P)-dependent dehydrogenase (short-subunit alcohol dehydrogenase family)